MANEGHLLRVGLIPAHLLVEEIATAEERLGLPPVGVHAINCRGSLLTIDRDSLVEALLIGTEQAESHAEILVTTLHDLDRICIDLAHRADGSLGILKLGLECPARCGGPIHLSPQMVLGDHVLVRLEPKRIHFSNY